LYSNPPRLSNVEAPGLLRSFTKNSISNCDGFVALKNECYNLSMTQTGWGTHDFNMIYFKTKSYVNFANVLLIVLPQEI
jgi:ubiquitin C-terminal hydrolase